MKHIITALALLASIYPGLNAQTVVQPIDTVNQLKEIVVSVPYLHTMRQRVAGSAGVTDASKIKLATPAFAADYINTIPGVLMQQGTPGTARITIRGVGSRSPYATTRIKAWFNDIPLTSGDGTTIIEDIPNEFIARAEVLRGTASAFYGNGTGGTVTLTNRQDSSGTIYAEQASFGLSNTGFGLNHGHSQLQVARLRSDGFRQNNAHQRDALYYNYNRMVGSNKITLSVLGLSVRTGIPSSLDFETFTQTPEKAAANWLAVKGYETYKKAGASLTAESNGYKKWSNRLAIATLYNNGSESRPFNILSDKSTTLSARNQTTLDLETVTLFAGMAWLNDTYHWQTYKTNQGERNGLLTENTVRRQNADGFTGFKVTVKNRFTADVTLNINQTMYAISDAYDAHHFTPYLRYSSGLNLSPRAGFNWQIAHNAFLYGSAGSAVSAPSVEESLLPSGTVNTDLKPEKATTFEWGIRGSLDMLHLTYDICNYLITVEHMIVTQRLPDDSFIFENAGQTRLTGLEVMLSGKYFKTTNGQPRIQADLNACYSKNSFETFWDHGQSYNGNQLPGIPAWYGSATVTTNFGCRSHITIKANRQGKQYLNDANTATYHAFTTVDGMAGYTIPISRSTELRLSGGIRNIADTQYASMVVVNAPVPQNGKARYYYPGQPRNWFAKLAFGF